MGISFDVPGQTADGVPDPVDAAAYAWVVEHGRMDTDALAGRLGIDPQAVEEALDRLAEWHLIHRDPQDPTRMHALEPQSAANAACAPIEARIAHFQEEAARSRARLAGFLPHYLDATRGQMPGQGVEVITHLPEVRAALERTSAECRSEVLASQPGGSRLPEAMQEALRRDHALLSRGVRMRTLYHHTARFNGPSQAYVEAASKLGAEYRTAHQLFGRLIVFDRETAFVPLSDGSWGAVVVRQEDLVAYLCEVFEQTWELAQPFTSAAEDGLELVSQEIDRTIIRLLATGLKDEAIARRVGLSLRTARRHIADIMEQLGAESRFQAGAAAMRAGLLDD